jgi:uncharacterized protein (DUF305 family)
MNKQHVVKAALTALALGAALGLAGCGGNNDAGGMGGMDHGSGSPQMSQMPSSSTGEASPSSSTAAQFNDADVMFVQGMLPHHQQAVEMSDMLLKKSGVSAGTTALAQQVKAAQGPEITTMQGWLKAWGKDAAGGMGGMDHDMGGGMATEAEMKEFDQADAKTGEKMFLEMMTAHHQGAIAMAQMEVKNGKNPDTIAMATNIASSQQAEIETMKTLLADL